MIGVVDVESEVDFQVTEEESPLLPELSCYVDPQPLDANIVHTPEESVSIVLP